MNWNKYPFVRMVVALALGILLGDRVGKLVVDLPVLMGALALLILAVWVLHRTLKTYRYRWTFGLAVLVTLVWMGLMRMAMQQVKPTQPDAANRWRLARVLEPPEEREKTVKVLLEMEQGRVMAYLEKEESALALEYGDLIGFHKAPQEVDPPKNPNEFNYKKHLERQGVTGNVFLKKGDWLPTGVRRTNPVFAFAYRFRKHLLQALQRCGITGDEFGVGAAILLGDDDSLPDQVRHNYVAAGSMHILCVSGMHVGMIYVLASFLLGLLGENKRIKRMNKIILLLMIWLYALITGLSPSIMRSALMISFMVFGELIHRKGFALNAIAASAFILLLINPNHLFAMGFQLSYGAVLGIVLLQRPIYNLLYIKSKWLDRAWEITAVSLAAQVATMPFSIYYFNQFTPYFWLSNLLMTPLSFVVILTGMLLLLISWVPWVSLMVGKMVWLSIHVMNGVVSGIEQLPMSLVKGLFLTDFQFVLSLLLLVLLWLLVNLRKKRMVMELLVIAAVFAFSQAWRSQQLSQQSQVMFFSLRNHTAISIVDGFDHLLLCDAGLLGEPSAIDYSLKGYWAERQLPMNPRCHTLSEDFSEPLAIKRRQLVSTQGRVLAFWDPATTTAAAVRRLAVDCLMVRERQKPDLKRITSVYWVGMLLIDSSVPETLADEWQQQAEALNIPCRNLRDGAFVL